MRASLQIVGEWSDVRTGVPDGMSIRLLAQVRKMECCTKINWLNCAICILKQLCAAKDRKADIIPIRVNRKMVLQMGGKTSAASKNKWNEKTYDRINLVVRKGQKEQIQDYAKEKGMSLNAYINALIQADMGEHLTPGVVKNLEGDTDPVE